jgi:hypothetical protein
MLNVSWINPALGHVEGLGVVFIFRTQYHPRVLCAQCTLGPPQTVDKVGDSDLHKFPSKLGFILKLEDGDG